MLKRLLFVDHCVLCERHFYVHIDEKCRLYPLWGHFIKYDILKDSKYENELNTNILKLVTEAPSVVVELFNSKIRPIIHQLAVHYRHKHLSFAYASGN